MSAIGILQTIPSLAMLALLLPFFGIGVAPALVALILYALLPIVRNTLTGIENIAPEHIEAANALGLTEMQKLRIVVLPLALPTIVAGIRTAAVIGVGVATLATFIGAGGLGDFINRGLATNSTGLVLLGAIPAALLAILIDYLVHCLERWVSAGRRHPARKSTGHRRFVLSAISLLLAALVISTWPWTQRPEVVRVGSKNFTEQFVLAEIIAQLIEKYSDLSVERRFNLGSVVILHQAMLNNEIDIYPEYTGTAYRVIMKREDNPGADPIYRRVRDHYRETYSFTWTPPFGFNDTYAIAVRSDFAREHGLKNISDLQEHAPDLNIGFVSEFFERPDGYEGLTGTYGLDFGDTTEMDMSLLYKAARNGEIDVLSGNTTDGRIPAYDLTILHDDRNYFPPYYAAPVVRMGLLESHPELTNILERIAGQIDEQTMQRLNFQVDEQGLSPRTVAMQFLEKL
jgi:osmoprotectant transport system permease protein